MFMKEDPVSRWGRGHHNGMGSKTCRTPNVARKFSKSESAPRLLLLESCSPVARLYIDGCGLEQLVGDAAATPRSSVSISTFCFELNAVPVPQPAMAIDVPPGSAGRHLVVGLGDVERRLPPREVAAHRELPALGEVPGVRERDASTIAVPPRPDASPCWRE
jgi:hypothetical protein